MIVIGVHIFRSVELSTSSVIEGSETRGSRKPDIATHKAGGPLHKVIAVIKIRTRLEVGCISSVWYNV